jgi:4-hydroxy-2-oxoheptanedioate aldolase
VDKLLEDITDGRPSIGLAAGNSDLIELCAFIGFRWVMIDQMFSANDWARTEELIRTSEAASITPVVRLQSYPWIGYDHRIAVDLARAMGIGARYIMVSHSEMREIDECIVVSKDWHRKPLTIHPYRGLDDWGHKPTAAEDVFVIPQPESNGALESLDAAIRNPDVRVVFIATTDASRMIAKSDSPDFYNPALWEFIDRAVELGKEHNVVIGASTSWAYTLDELRRRIETLAEHGVKMIMAQSAPFLLQLAATKLLDDLAPTIKPHR